MAKRSNTTSIPYAAKKKTFWQLLWKQKALCIMALAPLIMLIIFKYVPMYGILIAFKNYKASKGVWGSNWLEPVLKNFIKFFKNVNSGQIIWNTLKIGVLNLLFTFPAAIIFAILLNELRGKVFKSAVQTISYIPFCSSYLFHAKWIWLYYRTFQRCERLFGNGESGHE